MTQSNPHLPNSEQIDAYITGGLSAEEREAFEAHLNECAACANALVRARESDLALRNLLSDAQPPAGFEDRMIQATRRERVFRLPIPVAIRRAATAAAAIVVISGIGYFGGNFLSSNNGIALLNQVKCSSNLRQIGQAILMYANENKGPVAASPPAAGWQLNRSLPADYAVASDISNGRVVRAPGTTAADGDNGAKSRHSGDGQEARFGDGKVDWTKNPFIGSQRDNIFTLPDRVPNAVVSPSRRDETDSILLPTDDNGRAEDAKKASPPSSPAPGMSRFKPIEMASAPAGNRTGAESVAQNSGAIQLGTDLRLNSTNSYAGATVVSSGTVGANPVPAQAAADPGQALAFAITPLPDKGENAGQAGAKAPAPPANPAPIPADTRRVIRNGTMEFEVDSFDTALAQITKITGESGGFVSTTDSDKLPNGKVKGTVTLRVSPERLDVLVLSLRALGDLKSQQIKAEDVSKQYNDLESALAAARAMEARLIDLIKSGNGQIKDLLAAEKELGVWREKIEQAEGEIRFYNNQISMSTLSIMLYERDIKTAAVVTETETADTGIEAEDVEKARTEALKAIDDAKGRVIDAELKRFDAGQLAASIVADVPSEASGAVIDRLKQLGRVARLEIHRQQITPEGADPATAATPLRIERKPTHMVISLYNLANVAPRRTTNVTIAANDVEAAYEKLISQVKALGAGIVTSNLDHSDPAQASGSIVFDILPDQVDAAQTAISGQGDVLKRTLVENADTQNTTESKHGFTVQLVSLASVAPREVIQQLAAAADVPAEYHAVLNSAIAAHARIRGAQLNEQDRQNVTGTLEFEVMRAQFDTVAKAIDAGGQIIAREVSHADAAQNTVDSKVMIRLTIKQADRVSPRETTAMEIQVADAAKAAADAQASATAAGGEVVDAKVNKDRAGRETATVVLSVPLSKSNELLDQLRSSGTVRSIDSTRDANAPGGPVARAFINLTFATSDAIVANDTGLLSTIRNGLATSVAGLLLSVQLLVIGLCLVGPWVLIGWVAWRLWRRGRKSMSPIIDQT